MCHTFSPQIILQLLISFYLVQTFWKATGSLTTSGPEINNKYWLPIPRHKVRAVITVFPALMGVGAPEAVVNI